MKKLLILFIILGLAGDAFSQNIGIGTGTPGAKLQINHRNTGASPAVTLLDSTAGTGSKLLFSKQGLTNNFSLLSTIDLFVANSSLDIRTTFNSGIFLRGDGRVGINNVTSPTATLHIGGGVKINDTLHVGGGVKIDDTLHVTGNIKADTIKPNALKILPNAGPGKILTSDALGNASWQSLTGIGSSKFLVTTTLNSHVTGRMGYSITSGFTQSDSVDFASLKYNIGTDFTVTIAGSTNNHILVNSDGLYHIEGVIRMLVVQPTSGLVPLASIELNYDPPAGAPFIFRIADDVVLPQIDFATPFAYIAGVPFSVDIYFTAGTTFTLNAAFSNLTNFPINSLAAGDPGYISCYKISD